MAMYKCKMCGGALDVQENMTVIECDYCGAKQTVPTVKDEHVQGLFNRANMLRMKSEFDKAEQLYEKILQVDGSQAEAYWGLILCKYGIEYVEDPKTFERVPTCHRTSFESIIADEDYKSALTHADCLQRSLYEKEAAEIDRLQKEILALSQREEPYDVFICYKETDGTGARTQDSVIANEIYYQLTNVGFKVFYAAVSLEDKLGSAYEPCIFAALHSSKVMLVVGTKPEFFNAVWVKNEWSRFLKMTKADRSKLLIPCYKDMDAYELPDEFAHLQAQDMSKIGFINDVVRGIQKILGTTVVRTQTTQADSATGNAAVVPLLKRIFLFLEDGEWDSADEYCEKVLDLDPECAKAYIGKMLAARKLNRTEDLLRATVSFEDDPFYRKAVRFADEAYHRELDDMLMSVKQAITQEAERKAKEEAERKAREEIERKEAAERRRIAEEARRRSEEAKRQEEEAQRKEREEQDRKTADERRRKLAPIRRKLKPVSTLLSAGIWHTVGLKSDGTVVAVGDNTRGRCNVSAWSNIEAVAAGGGHTVGLQSNGTVVAVGENDEGQCDVDGWTGISAVAAGGWHTVGLKTDGTVVAAGSNQKGQCLVADWKNMTAVAAGGKHTVGLKSDGTVIAVGDNENGQCRVSGWNDIVAIAAGVIHTVGLKSDGAVVATGSDVYGQCRTSLWRNMVAISAGRYHTVALNADGMVFTIGNNDQRQSDAHGWRDVVAIAAGWEHTVALKKDGSVFAIGKSNSGQCRASSEFKLFENVDTLDNERSAAKERLSTKVEQLHKARQLCQSAASLVSAGVYHTVALNVSGTVMTAGSNDYGRCNVTGWKNITAIAAGGGHTVGLLANGTVVAVGENSRGQCNTFNWTRVTAVSASAEHTVGLTADGAVLAVGNNDHGECGVFGWRNITAVSAGIWHTVGLKSDGTVVAVGYDKDDDRCSGVAAWKNIVAIAAGGRHSVGLTSHGTVVAVGDNGDGQCNVFGWRDIVAIAAGVEHTIGIKADGTVVATGNNKYGACNVSGWRDIVAVASFYHHTIGIKADGTLVAVGENEAKQCNIGGVRVFYHINNAGDVRRKTVLRANGVCQHCGGAFSGTFVKKCVNCGAAKDY